MSELLTLLIYFVVGSMIGFATGVGLGWYFIEQQCVVHH
jgi:hypothetical protein